MSTKLQDVIKGVVIDHRIPNQSNHPNLKPLHINFRQRLALFAQYTRNRLIMRPYFAFPTLAGATLASIYVFGLTYKLYVIGKIKRN